MTEPLEALEALAGSVDPLLIGVRHHSPACAAVMERLLDAFAPTELYIELPVEFTPWLPWLGHAETRAPVALASAEESGAVGFYPFADFSPELVAIRWATARGIPVHAFDDPRDRSERVRRSGGPALMETLLTASGAPDFEALWDRMVEAPAPGSEPEAVRRAALALGWALRRDAEVHGVSAFDLGREAHMRACLAEGRARGVRAAAVVGAFHAPALLAHDEVTELPAPPAKTTSLIPYAHDLLDSRSGYPAGIRDPMWQQRVFETLGSGDPQDVGRLAAEVVTEVCRLVRASDHVAGVPDARESVRMALDLARLRGLPAPGRREVLEGIETGLGRGELLGRGVILGRALERVLVGGRRGKLAPGTPRSGLVLHVEERVAQLRVPGPEQAGDEPKLLRLDVVRSGLDRARAIFFARLSLCGVHYAELRQSVARETLTEVWTAGWRPATDATLALASTRGVTLEQAAEGTLRGREGRLKRTEEWTAASLLDGLQSAAAAGLPRLANEYLGRLETEFVAEAGFAEIVAGIGLLGRLERGHIAGFQVEGDLVAVLRATLVGAAVRGLEGISGSKDLADAAALRELVDLYEAQPTAAQWADGRLAWALDRMVESGSALMVGASSAARVFMDRDTVASLSERLGSWIDGARTAERRRDLALILHGVLTVAAPLFEASPLWARGVLEHVERTGDDRFLEVLPALRDGFGVLSPADRGRLLAALGAAIGDDALAGRRLDATLDHAPELLGRWAVADRAGLKALEALGLGAATTSDSVGSAAVEPASSVDAAGGAGGFVARGAGAPGNPDSVGMAAPVATGSESASSAEDTDSVRSAGHQLAPADRWRLILGQQREQLSQSAARYGRALDELYGGGRGEGAGTIGGQGGGKEDGYPTTREWADDLQELFGTQVREEVLGRAAEGGRAQALAELDPDQVTASVQLLEQVLALRGSLPEARLPQLRRLVERVVEQLVKELSTQLRPALAGLTTPTPTRRPGGPLDLRTTIRRNLDRARVNDDGDTVVVPTSLHFKTRARRSMDWRILLVVDISGSMEPSVIYSALMAAILAGLPAVDVRFLAFNTQVIDFSERVSDPLSLLMEVEVGGGTHIAKAMRFARGLVKVPQRTLMLVVSDFEEGFSVSGLLSEVRAVVDSGVTALGLASLDDAGAPRYSAAIAGLVAGAGMPVAALSPMELARWVGEQVRGR